MNRRVIHQGWYDAALHSLLQYRFDSGIIDMETKMRQLPGVASTREPAQVQHHLHSGHPAAPLSYYTTSSPPVQGGILPFACRGPF